MAKIHFLHHSSFAVEFPDKVLIFDWFDPARFPEVPFTGVLPDFTGKKQYFFASHKHRDHFDMDILRRADLKEPVRFILSKDCKMSGGFLRKHGFDTEKLKGIITYVNPVSDYEVDDLKIHTLRSTDEGVAFYVETNDRTIYHAGDLNWWKWEGVGEIINGRVERDYKHQLKYLEGKLINYAFVVLDPRLNEHAFLGLDYFMKQILSDHVFPMHTWQDYELVKKYKSRSDNKAFTDRIVEMTGENETFSFGEDEEA